MQGGSVRWPAGGSQHFLSDYQHIFTFASFSLLFSFRWIKFPFFGSSAFSISTSPKSILSNKPKHFEDDFKFLRELWPMLCLCIVIIYWVSTPKRQIWVDTRKKLQIIAAWFDLLIFCGILCCLYGVTWDSLGTEMF